MSDVEEKKIDERTPLIQRCDDGRTGEEDDQQAANSSEPVASIVTGGVQQQSAGGGRFIKCRVCGSSVDILGKNTQYVVKCLQCNETTPIRPPPAGKKFVRCPCNCLLLCKQASTRIACPRPDCKRVITLNANSLGTATRAPPGTVRISCVYCSEVFMYNMLNKSLARCPHCRKLSSIGQRFVRIRAAIFLIIGLMFAFSGIGLAAATWHTVAINPAIYVAWAAIFLLAAVFVVRAIYYLTLKTSIIEGPL